MRVGTSKSASLLLWLVYELQYRQVLRVTCAESRYRDGDDSVQMRSISPSQ